MNISLAASNCFETRYSKRCAMQNMGFVIKKKLSKIDLYLKSVDTWKRNMNNEKLTTKNDDTSVHTILHDVKSYFPA